MKKSKSVPIQKGKVIANPMTMKQMPYPERVSERKEEMKKTRMGQTMSLHEPKRGKK